MKLNIIKVLNEINAEEATVVMLNNPDAVWNLPNNDADIYDDYLYYKRDTEIENDDTWDMIEWNEKHGHDYSGWLKYLKKVMTFEEWLAEENKMRANYMVNRIGSSIYPFDVPNTVNKMINIVNENRKDAINAFVKMIAA